MSSSRISRLLRAARSRVANAVLSVARRRSALFLPLSLVSLWFTAPDLRAAPPESFAVEDVLTGLDQPIALRFLPDGRLLVLLKKGDILITNPSATPAESQVYLDLSSAAHPNGIKADQERGLLDIAIDPDFPTQPYIYLFYTPNSGPNGQRSRIARFTHIQNSGGLTSRANPGSEVILWQDTDGYDSCCHFGGGLDFGPDGKLWLTVGDHFQGSYAASLEHAGGSVHRINKDGSIPADNPYIDGAGPNVDSMVAYGLRNPFRARWDFPSNRFFIAEVGGNTQSIAWEDLHVIDYDPVSGDFIDADYGTAQDNFQFDGINFGWPTVEGLPPHHDFPGWQIDNVVGEPIFGYRHNGLTAAINGGVVYRGSQFPVQYRGGYFYADSTRDFIRYIKFDAEGNVVPNPNPDPISAQNPDLISYPFDLAPLGRIVCLDVGPDGSLYYVSFTDSGGAYGQPNPSTLGAVRRYVYDGGNSWPVISQFAVTPASGISPLNVTFSLRASDPESHPLTYRIHFGDGTSSAPVALAPNTTVNVAHTYAVDGPYTATLEVSDPGRTSTAQLAIEAGTPPTIVTLTADNPRAGAVDTTFRFGDTITFAATANDAEDGPLPPAAFSWSIVFVRPGNIHPTFGPESGTTSIQFPIPSQGQGFSDAVYYRCFLTVTDSSGLSTTSHIDILPEKTNITFDTSPSGIVVQVDGNTARQTPFVLDTLVNFPHVVTVPEVQCINGTEYTFSHWSNGANTAQQVYTVPTTDSSLTAVYAPSGECISPPTGGLALHLSSDFGLVLNGSTVTAWEDQTSNNNVLTAVGAPTRLTDALNGRPVVRFDGVDDALARTGLTGFATGAGDRSLFMVVRYNNTGTGNGWAGLTYGSTASNQAFGLSLTPQGMLGVQGWGPGNDIISDPPTPGVGAWLIQGAILSGNVLTQYRDGSPIGTVNHTYATTASALRLGEELNGNRNVPMEVAEILVYNRALTPAELTTTIGYLQDRYMPIGPGNMTPTVSITAPDNAAEFDEGDSITFSATASDPEDGDLSSTVSWASSLDGTLGTGASINRSNLSVGTHTISATVTDSGDLSDSDTLSVIINIVGGNTAPTVAITAPADGSTFSAGSPITFTGTATDVESGNLAASLTWTSDRDGGLGTGASITTSALTVGTHVITASATDPGNLSGTDSITLTVGAAGPLPAGLVFHLRSDAGVATTGSAVTGWSDQVGTNHLSAIGAPTVVANQLNGLPAVRFDGVDDALLRNGLTGFPTGSADRSVWLVARYHSTGSGNGWAGLAYGTNSPNRVFGLTLSPAGTLGVQGWGVGNDILTSPPSPGVGPWLVHSAILANNTLSQYRDGTAAGTAGHTYDTAANTLRLGEELNGNRNLNMDVAEVLVFNRALSAGERAQVDAYLADRYAFGGTPGNTAPVVNITAPADGASFASGASVSFTATATDAESGNLATGLTWTSSRDGALGTGGSISTSTLSVGTHTITAAVSDAGGLAGQDTVTVTVGEPAAITPTAPIALFNGTSLTGLYPWFSDTGFSDPDQIFRVENGLLRVTGDGWGALTTQQRYRDYIAVLEFKWGDGTFGPRVNNARDAGLCLHSNGPEGAWQGLLIPHHQVQMMEGAMGDLMVLPDTRASAPPSEFSFTSLHEQVTCGSAAYCRGGYRWNSTGTPRNFNQHLATQHWFGFDPDWQNVKGYRGPIDLESPQGQWNQLVIVANGATVSVYFNGTLVNQATNVTPTAGKLQLEVEWAEFFVRRWELLPLNGNAGPAIVNETLSPGAVGSSYSQPIKAVGGTSPRTWSIVSGSLPAGLALNASTGVISGTPSAAGTFAFTARVTDQSGATANQAYSLVIQGASTGLVTDGLVLQLESDLNVALQSGATIAGWLDQSGWGNDLVASGNPQLLATGTPSGLPALRFDGNGDNLQRVHATSPLGGLPTGNANRTLFLVARYNNAGGAGGLVYGTGANNQAFGLVARKTSGELVLQGWGSGRDLISTTPGNGAGWLVQSGVLAGGTATLFKDGVQIGQKVNTYGTVLTKLVIGEEINQLGFVAVDVAAALIYNRALTPAERASVEGYLNAKYLGSGPTNQAPTVTITAPADNASFAAGAAVTFTATASDPEDGSLAGALSWSSSRDGALGTGSSINRSNLSVGSHVITATATDTDGAPGSDTVSITIEAAPANTPPTISNVADQTIPAGGTTGALAFTVGDAETAPGSLTVTRASSNTTVIPLANVVLGGTGANRTVTVSPASGQTGSSDITLSVSDGAATTTTTFTVTVQSGPPPVDPALWLGHAFNEASGTIAQDSSPNNNDGTLTGSVTRVPGGQHGAALDFAGGRVGLGALNISGTAFTIAAWIRADSFGPNNEGRIISKASGTAESSHYWMLSTISNNGIKPRMRLRTSSGATSTLVGTTNLSTGTWTHLAGTYDGAMMRLYVNGVAAGSRTRTGTVSQSGTVPAAIGDQPQGGRGFDGLIDDVRVYTRALSGTELQAIMTQGLPAAN